MWLLVLTVEVGDPTRRTADPAVAGLMIVATVGDCGILIVGSVPDMSTRSNCRLSPTRDLHSDLGNLDQGFPLTSSNNPYAQALPISLQIAGVYRGGALLQIGEGYGMNKNNTIVRRIGGKDGGRNM